MNLFLDWIKESGEEELATPPLDDSILPGVRGRALWPGRQRGEFKVSGRHLTLGDSTIVLEQNRGKEVFGPAIAGVVGPVSDVLHKGET